MLDVYEVLHGDLAISSSQFHDYAKTKVLSCLLAKLSPKNVFFRHTFFADNFLHSIFLRLHFEELTGTNRLSKYKATSSICVSFLI